MLDVPVAPPRQPLLLVALPAGMPRRLLLAARAVLRGQSQRQVEALHAQRGVRVLPQGQHGGQPCQACARNHATCSHVR